MNTYLNFFGKSAIALLFVITVASCSKDSNEIDPDNINVEDLMVGSWSISEIKEFEDGTAQENDPAIAGCLSRAAHMYRSDGSYAIINPHHWIYGGTSGGGCQYMPGEADIETATWKVIENNTVKVEVYYNNGGSAIRQFEPIFLNKNTYMTRTEYSSSATSRAREVYFSRN